MRAATVGRRGLSIVVAAGAAVAAGALAVRGPGADPDEPPRVFEPGPEAPGAARKGARDVERAQALARRKKLAEAVSILERVAATYPSAAHDCNLSLAYLRAGDLTRAQLVWDLARLRPSTPPAWCTSELAGELATALRDRGYVPLTISVTPADATVEVAGITLRSIYVIWLPAGTQTLRARAPGLVEQATPLAIAPPAARVAITLEPPRPVEEPPVDAAVAPPPVVDAAPPVDPAPVPIAPPSSERPVAAPPSRTPAWIGLGVGAGAVLAGAIFHGQALATKDDANQLVNDTDAYRDARDRFGRERGLAIGGYAVGGAALGFAAWWLWGRAEPARTDAPAVGVQLGQGGAMVTAGWSTGGP